MKYPFRLPQSFAVALVFWSAHCAMAATIGPDAFGYRVTNETPYAFEEIVGAGGTPLNLTDDSFSFPIPFNFNFYGTNYNQVGIQSNGTVTFQNSYLGFVNESIPSANSYGVNRFIAAYWDDLNPDAGGDVYWQVRGAGPTERLIVEWKDVPIFPQVGAGTFQLVLYRQSREIYAYYADTNYGVKIHNFGVSATAGIQSSPSVGLQWSFSQTALLERMALRYYLIPEPASIALSLLAVAAIGPLPRRRKR